MFHLIIAGIIAYLVVHFMFSAHHYRRSTRHRSFLHRCYLSVPGPFHTRISRRL